MVTELRRADLLSAHFPMLLLIALAALGAAAWIGAHWLRGRLKERWQGHGLLAVGALIGAATVWLAFQLASRFLVLDAAWSLWSIAWIAAAAVEVAVWLYEVESAQVSRGAGSALLGLRIAMILLLAVVLAQPVLWWETRRDVTRYAAVLVDDSASMHMADRALSPSEKLRLAALFDLQAVRDRPPLDLIPDRLAGVADRLSKESQGLQAIPDTDAAAFTSFLEKQGASLGELLQEAIRSVTEDCASLGKGGAGRAVPAAARKGLEDIRTRLAMNVGPRLAEAMGMLGGRKAPDGMAGCQGLLRALNAAGEELGQVLNLLPAAIDTADEAYYRALGPEDVKAVEGLAAHTRMEIARDVLAASKSGQKSLMELLKSKYTVKFIRFASSAVPTDADAWLAGGGKEFPPAPLGAPASDDGARSSVTNLLSFQDSTDIGAALDSAAGEAPADSLAGVLVLTDGRHNGKVLPEAAARRLGALGAPVCTVVIGSGETPKDAAVLDVVVPVSVYLGDKVNVQASLRFDALRGGKAKVRLLQHGELVEEITVDVPEDEFRTSVNMSHTPVAVGTYDYEVEVEPMEGERLTGNNRWGFRVAASDNRMNVLMVEGVPRWEFRYLRNLLYARDRAVHLQYVLLDPDRVEGAKTPGVVYASAGRKFGDAEATALPRTKEEWMRFDAIILGDVSPGALDNDTLATLQHCVLDRGALLVVVAGPRFMPHAYTSRIVREMLPVRYAQSETSFHASPEPLYQIRLTPDGSAHPMMRQAGGAQENRELFESFPPLVWRQPVAGVKEGASVLASAVPISVEDRPDATNGAAAAAGKRLKEEPLVVVQPYGLGHVVALNFDETWRLRYRKGDVHHHKFWGQLLRWGVGDKLRSGTELVRIGTDRLTYALNAPVRVEARILDTDFKAVTADEVYVSVSRDGKDVLRKKLDYRRDSCGIYEVALPAMPGAGLYKAKLESGKIFEILAAEKATEASTEFMVVAKGNSQELSELSADWNAARTMAGVSGGKAVGPESAASALDVFGPGSRRLSEIREVTLWDSWPLLALLILVITAEWILRRRKGMA